MSYWYKLYLVLLTTQLACKQDVEVQTHQTSNQNEETLKMVEELKAISTAGNILEMWHQNEARAKNFEQLASQTTDPSQKFGMMFQSAVEWLNAGEYEKSIALFQSVIDQHESGQFRINENSIKQFYELLAIAYMRKGEVENCVHHHDKNSCIVPIEASAQHSKRKGSEEAIKIYEKLLADNPQDLQNIWLYNIAQMTLGNYPDNMKQSFLIPEERFQSEYILPKFDDVASAAGVAVNDISGGCIIDDFNNDGFLDIIASSYGIKDQIRYFQNDGNGKFSDKTSASGLSGLLSGLNLKQADYNNDGHMDFIVLRGAWLGGAGQHPNSLIRNNGDGTFSDVTRSSGIYSLHPTQTASWGDFNNDGWIDLFVGNESTNNSVHRSELFVNQKDGTFKELSSTLGLDISVFVKGSAWGDIDNDGDLDLLISNLLGANKLYENTGSASGYRFKDVSEESGIQLPQFSFPCWFWDVNNDGLLDVFINSFDIRDFSQASAKVAANYLGIAPGTEFPALYINKGGGRFEHSTLAYNLDKVLYTMGCNISDIDNDGYMDFYAATGTPDFRAIIPNRMFRNDNGKSFQDVTTATGTGHIQKGHGVSFGDLDNDGDNDLYHVIGGSYSGDNFMNALFKNNNNENNWISIELEGVESNRAGIGSRVEIEVLNDNSQIQKIFRIVDSGASFGANSLRQCIGLGKAQSIQSLKVRWQGSGLVQEFNNIEINKFYRLQEKSTELESYTLKQIKL